MLSRTAESLFWIGRYMERAENHARLIDVHYHLQHEADFHRPEHKWERMIDALSARTDYLRQFDKFTENDVLSFITLDRGNANSLFCCILQARTNLRTIREKLPGELWEMLNAFYLWLGEKQVADIISRSPSAFYRHIREHTAMFQGLEHSVMSRESEWHLIESGRHLERTENSVRILQSVLTALTENENAPYPYLLAILQSVSGYQAFRKAYADAFTTVNVLEFLVTNATFPRSLYFAVSHLEEHLHHVTFGMHPSRVPHERAVRLAEKMKVELACLEADEITLAAVPRLLHHLMEILQTLGHTITDTLFRLGEASA